MRGSQPQIAPDAFDLLLLERLPGVGLATVQRLVGRFGSAERALTAPSRDFAAIASSDAARARTSAVLRSEVDAGLERALRDGVRVVSWSCDDYPPWLRHLADPPPVLFLRGREDLLTRQGVTIVGARRATERSKDVANRLSSALARAGCVVVSGLALGIDRAAHEGALRVGGDTIAVLGTGVDVVYPRSHAAVFRRIANQGLLVSEFLPGTEAAPYHFPRRNRILAALSGATVVVEAGRRSGSLITVDHALDIGREVWVVPGPIESRACVGSNRLLAEGARPVLSIADCVQGVAGPEGAESSDTPSPEPGRRETATLVGTSVGGVGADGSPEQVLSALAEGPMSADELAARIGLPVQQALALLTTLELYGDVERLAGMRFRRAA